MKAKTLIGVQDEFIQAVLAGAARWSHRKGYGAYRFGGHFPRICRGAHTKAIADLAVLGFSKEVAEMAIQQAWEMAELELMAEAS